MQSSLTRAFAAEAAEVKLPPQFGIPGRYAAALYMAAAKGNKLDAVEKELGQVASLLSESKDFNSFVSDPSVPRKAKMDGIQAIMGKMNASDITKNFVNLLSDNNRLEELPKIVGKFGDIAAEQRGQVKAIVTTASGLGKAELQEIQKGLKQMLKPGQSLVLEEKIDASIISGIILDIGDKHLDLSVLSRVRKLQQIIRDAL